MMASFGDLTSKAKARAERLQKYIAAAFTRIPTTAGDSRTNTGTEAVIRSTAKFLAGFGAEVVRLNKHSKNTLSKADPEERSKLRAAAIEKLTSNTKREVTDAVERFSKGRLTEDGLRNTLQGILRSNALSAAIIGVGGVGNLTANVLEAVRRQLSDNFDKLDGFIDELKTRELTNRDRARFNQYANNAHSISNTANRQFNLDTYGDPSGLEERRILGGAEHCDDCIALAAEGWVPAGSLPPIGVDTVCGDSCRCTIITRPTTRDSERVEPVPEADGGS